MLEIRASELISIPKVSVTSLTYVMTVLLSRTFPEMISFQTGKPVSSSRTRVNRGITFDEDFPWHTMLYTDCCQCRSGAVWNSRNTLP